MSVMKQFFVRRLSTASSETNIKSHFWSRSRSQTNLSEDHQSSRSQEECVIYYMGYSYAKDAQAVIKMVRLSAATHKRVKLSYRDLQNHSLSVYDEDGERVLSSALRCIQDINRGSSDCFAVTFAAGPLAKQCHVFQAKSNREAADIVQALQRACRSASKAQRSSGHVPVSFQRHSSVGDSPRVAMHRSFMEDEDEIIEHKPIFSLSRRESKKVLARNRVSVESPTISRPASLTDPVRISTSQSFTSLPRRGSKSSQTPPRTRRKSAGRRDKGNEREFTRKDMAKQLLNAVDRVIENNSSLRQLSRQNYPLSPFQDALYALYSNNMELFRNYLNSGRIHADATDSLGNTLLHYATALGRAEAVKILCNHMASLNSPGWNDCRPLHRAATEGHIAVLQALLVRGADVNGTDKMGRTALHMVARKPHLIECTIALLEYGAQIFATDVLGLTPFDLNSELTETQNRLVTSACEAFTSTQSKDPAAASSLSSPSVTSTSSSTLSTRPSSLVGEHVTRLHPLSHACRDPELNELLKEVNPKAIAFRKKAYARKLKFKQSMLPRRRSFGNLSELRESEEDEMYRQTRLQLLKFPSEFKLNSDCYEGEGSTDLLMRAITDVMKTGKRARRDVEGSSSLDGSGLVRRELLLSEPNLPELDLESPVMSPEPRPLSSQAILQREHGRDTPTKFLKLRAESVTSQGSTDLYPAKQGSIETDSISTDVSHAPHLGPLDEPFSMPINGLQHKAEDLDSTVRSDRDSTCASPHDGGNNGIVFSVMNGTAAERDEGVFSPEPHSTKKPRGSKRSFKSQFKLRIGSIGSKSDLKAKRSKEKAMMKRKMSLPDVHINATVHKPPLDEISPGRILTSTTPTSSTMSLDTLLLQQYCSKEPTGSSPISPQRIPVNAVNSVNSRKNRGRSDPVANALKNMVTLSSNKECHSTLISYICLPKCASRLTTLAQSPSATIELLNNVATLIQNVFEGSGAEGKKNALSSGFLDLTIKLLNSRDPVPGTCLSLLNNLLVSEDDNDYLRTIIRIPTEPLLAYLQPCDSDTDTGLGSNRRRDASLSTTTHSSTENTGQPTPDGGSRSSSGLGGQLEVLKGETSARNLISPTLQGQLVTHPEARRIVLKMLAISSSHSKMQQQLGSPHAVRLISNCLTDPSQENITNAAISLANIAQTLGNQATLIQMGLPAKLHSLIPSGPRPRYHASRALVYLGELRLEGISLFEPNAYESDNVIMTTEADGHTYAKGATIEKSVELLTGNISQLWGGFDLATGPQSPTGERLAPKATKEQIVSFFLAVYQSFMHPVIFMRLLLHRLNSHECVNPFDWSVEPDQPTIPQISPSASVPPIQTNVLNVIGRWLEMFPENFLEHPQLQQDVLNVIQRLRLVRGPYIPQTHKLKSLFMDISRPRVDNSVNADVTKRVPHHENLYKLCKQMIVGGHLPVTLEQAISMAALQLHIEEYTTPSLTSKGIASLRRGRKSTMRLRAALPAAYIKAKNISKRLQAQAVEFEKLSERNSKHLYIECCQSLPGYDCTFFSVKVPSGGRFRRGATKQLLGISDKYIVFLDEKTKELVSRHSLQDVLSFNPEQDPCSLLLSLRGSSCRVVVENSGLSWEICNVLERCKEGEGVQVLACEDNEWSDSLLLHDNVEEEEEEEDSSDSISSSSTNSVEKETRPSRPSSADLLRTPKHGVPHRKHSIQDPQGIPIQSFHQDPQTSPHVCHTPSSLPVTMPTANGHIGEGSWRQLSREDSLGTELEETISPDEKPPFCDCPPDPEIPAEMNLNHLTLRAVLQCPLEVARQMTLIAHDRLCKITAVELLQKANLIPKPRSQRGMRVSNQIHTHSLPTLSQPETAIDKLAYRCNQVGNWVANTILQYEVLEERVEAVQRFIIIAKHCLDCHNYSSVMAIIFAGLGCTPIRRLNRTWEGVSKTHLELFREMDAILQTEGNYKQYREKLAATATPAVPYVGVFLKDLTFICQGNPDYLRGGLINIHKRRQVYATIEEIRHFQQDHYNYHTVPELQNYMLSYRPVPEDELHSVSHILEPRMRRSLSQNSAQARSISSVATTPNFSIFRVLTRSGSASASNLLRTT